MKALYKISTRSKACGLYVSGHRSEVSEHRDQHNMNMNRGQGYSHAYFLCKDRQILRLSVCFYGPDKTTISSVHSARITLPRRPKYSAPSGPWLHAIIFTRYTEGFSIRNMLLYEAHMNATRYTRVSTIDFFPHGCTSTNSTMLT